MADNGDKKKQAHNDPKNKGKDKDDDKQLTSGAGSIRTPKSGSSRWRTWTRRRKPECAPHAEEQSAPAVHVQGESGVTPLSEEPVAAKAESDRFSQQSYGVTLYRLAKMKANGRSSLMKRKL
ncbi:hypothetical protein FOIG_06346 [Fusarium odoratissimum NRRL 54006]|uniref:Uncharacterized protein n=1 Tax=Fusarium odoratissimum (strain NRRL 54006) TaxID=1089451 RepID=X0K079_FUSO5|nr:uncharacterized protein FOIG_06346 [Fusarium odoratissimum NRRL 54006]EXM02031.1 hypothetical protein FOIG_06346 [Fusarium odoratissimum NRRL 54006]